MPDLISFRTTPSSPASSQSTKPHTPTPAEPAPQINSPTVAATASSLSAPYAATATAIANSNQLLAAVKLCVATNLLSEPQPARHQQREKDHITANCTINGAAPSHPSQSDVPLPAPRRKQAARNVWIGTGRGCGGVVRVVGEMLVGRVCEPWGIYTRATSYRRHT